MDEAGTSESIRVNQAEGEPIRRQPLQDFLSELPRVNLELREETWDPAFSLKAQAPRRYVWPDLVFESGPTNSKVLLITAPGAMGKSAAAAALAGYLNSPLIDLAQVPIGQDTLTGLLTRVLGWGQAPKLIDQLRGDGAVLVLDGLDEAQLAAGRAHYLAFLRNIVELMKGAGGSGRVVLLGRRDSIETAYLELEEHGLEPQLTYVAPLTYAQSVNLIDLALDDESLNGAEYRIHRVHATPFGIFRDATLHSIALSLGCSATDIQKAWESTGDFLGYPPVLLALAKFLIVENPGLLSAEGRRTSTTTRWRGDLLRQVVEEILDRESDKVRGQLSSPLRLPEDSPILGLLYARDEQVQRLISLLSGQESSIALPASLSGPERATYEDLLKSFVLDHPFLRNGSIENVVFSDYLHAYSRTSPIADIHPATGTKASKLEVGPFFCHFVSTLLQQGDANKIPELPTEDLIDSLIKSHKLGLPERSSFFYTQKAERAHLALFDQVTAGKAVGDESLVFDVMSPSGVLELTSPISNGLILTDSGISIQASGGDIELGSELLLVCSDLEFIGERITVSAPPKVAGHGHAGYVMIISQSPAIHEARLKVAAHPSDCLRISWPTPWHQWTPYIQDANVVNPALRSDVSWEVMFGLKRLLSAFHKSAADDPSLHNEMFLRYVVGSNEVFQQTLGSLLELGVIYLQGSLYRLNLERLKQFTVNYASLRGPDFQDSLKGLHAEVCKAPGLVKLLRL